MILSFSFGSTGSKQLLHNLGTVPKTIISTMGARFNATETAPIYSEGKTDLTRVKCRIVAPGISKAWPYTGEPNYFFVGYSAAGTKVISGTFTSVDATYLFVNVDYAVADAANYQVTFDFGT